MRLTNRAMLQSLHIACISVHKIWMSVQLSNIGDVHAFKQTVTSDWVKDLASGPLWEMMRRTL